jgi:hypothetical protein
VTTIAESLRQNDQAAPASTTARAGPTSPSPAALYGAVLAGYSELAFSLNVSGAELAHAAARD